MGLADKIRRARGKLRERRARRRAKKLKRKRKTKPLRDQAKGLADDLRLSETAERARSGVSSAAESVAEGSPADSRNAGQDFLDGLVDGGGGGTPEASAQEEIVGLDTNPDTDSGPTAMDPFEGLGDDGGQRDGTDIYDF